MDEIEHSVSPSLDFPFAKEKYKMTDSRYELVKAYKKLIFDVKGIEIYNCKIEIPKLAQDIYNVYIYLTDIKKELGESYNPWFNRNEDFITLFNQTLLKHPVIELKNRNLNRNGIFIQDFNKCAKAYALSKSFHSLQVALKQKYPIIEFLIFWDTTIYAFFPEHANFDDFLEKENIKHFKQFSYEIVKQYDAEKVCSPDNISFMLDDYANYKSIGGQHYFNSDAMSAGVFI
jgi:hypothetical protein